MQFFILVLLICLFIFLYCVYVLSNDDFIFLRRDLTMEKLFNIIFAGSLIGLFTARLFYGFFHAKSIFVNPLVFMLVPYFPGLSLLGGVVGIGVYLLFLTKRQKNPLPLRRMCDFFSISFLISLPVGFLGFAMFSQGDTGMVELGTQAIAYFILFIIFLKSFLPRLLTGRLKEGTITLLFLICFSLISLISNTFPLVGILDYLRNFQNIIFIIILFFCLEMLVRHENSLIRKK